MSKCVHTRTKIKQIRRSASHSVSRKQAGKHTQVSPTHPFPSGDKLLIGTVVAASAAAAAKQASPPPSCLGLRGFEGGVWEGCKKGPGTTVETRSSQGVAEGPAATVSRPFRRYHFCTIVRARYSVNEVPTRTQ